MFKIGKTVFGRIGSRGLHSIKLSLASFFCILAGFLGFPINYICASKMKPAGLRGKSDLFLFLGIYFLHT
jgi:hypothetical protein